MPRYDYLVVGAGMFGSVFARAMADRGARCLVIDRREHVGGNCWSREMDGIHVHWYGVHVLHTDDAAIWGFIGRFAEMQPFFLTGKANIDGWLYSFPVNLMTLHHIWGTTTPADAEALMREMRVPCEGEPRDLRACALAEYGPSIYKMFIEGYTRKQWGREPQDLPASIIRRHRVRYGADDRWSLDRYQGVPSGGYERLFLRMLDHERIEVRLGEEHVHGSATFARKVVFTGKIDEFFGYEHGDLEYRSLRHEVERLPIADFQGMALVNYPEARIPWTRIIEHKHLDRECAAQGTVITREYPAACPRGGEAFYPICDERNLALYDRYRAMAERSDVIFGGRLGGFRYLDMDKVAAQALKAASEETR